MPDPRPRGHKATTRLASTLLALTLAVVGCLGAEVTAPWLTRDTRLAGNARVLLIGNSLTYFNDLGTMMALVARSAGDTALRTATVAFADYALEDHIADGAAVHALRDSRWEYVVRWSFLITSRSVKRGRAPQAGGSAPALDSSAPSMVDSRWDSSRMVRSARRSTSRFHAAVKRASSKGLRR